MVMCVSLFCLIAEWNERCTSMPYKTFFVIFIFVYKVNFGQHFLQLCTLLIQNSIFYFQYDGIILPGK